MVDRHETSISWAYYKLLISWDCLEFFANIRTPFLTNCHWLINVSTDIIQKTMSEREESEESERGLQE